mmetsp:Transcript_102853/g.329959  ORF Transcript_102853/g.329959 Transcript_102853/m.329959 type:complete len:325 (-) Transcript_102853:87-1061(-)
MAEAMRVASMESSEECSFCARPRTTRTASKFSRSARVERRESRPVCAKESWLREEVASSMTSLAFAMAANSSPRLLVSASKSSALVRHSWCRDPLASTSVANSLEVASRSPSAPAFFSEAAAISCFASSISLVANLISSSKLCFNMSKFCTAVVSFLRRSSSCASALSDKPCKVSKMLPLWPSYDATDGAPKASANSLLLSSDDDVCCTNAESFVASDVPIKEACTMMSKALTKLSALLSCTNAAPPLFISRSMMPEAREIVSMVSMSSFSSALKSFSSCSRIFFAPARSASSVLMEATRSSTFEVCEEMVAISSASAAFNSST